MTEYSGGGATVATVAASVTKFNATIIGGNNSVTVIHNLGRIVKVNGVYGLDDNANIFIIKNEGVNSFDVAFQGGIAQPVGTDTAIEGTFV